MLLDFYLILCVVILFFNGCKVSFSERRYSSFIRNHKISSPCFLNHTMLLQSPDRLSDGFRAAPSLFRKVYIRGQLGSQRILSTQNTKENLRKLQ